MSDETAGVLFVLSMIVLSIIIYMLPSYVAFKRQHHQRVSILLLNIFLGWTLLGWVVSLVWAASAVQRVEISGHSPAR